MQKLSSQKGFTLLELLIASIIFAIMAIMAYGGLDNVISNSTSSKQALKRLEQIQKSVSVISRDLRQVIDRPIRDGYGNKQPYLSAGNDVDNLIEFSRGGRVNPANLLRSTLLRVAYRIDDNALVRLQWSHMDRTREEEPKKTTLIDNLEKASFRFLDTSGWQERWPALNTVVETDVYPLAIEIVLQLKDWGEIRRVYQIDIEPYVPNP